MVDAPGNLVHETTVSTSTGDLTVASTFGKRTFNTEFGTGGTDLFWYFVSSRDANEWEVGTGHLSSSTTLVRDTVSSSSNADALVNFSAGTKDVTNDIPALQDTFQGATLTPAQITANQNDYNPTGANVATYFRLDTDDVHNITGLAGGVANRIVVILNVGANDFVLTSDAALSTAANRFRFYGGDLRLDTNESVVLRYDGTNSKWRGIASHAALAGMVINTASDSYTTHAALTTVIPFDDTIPQNTEGTEILSAAITPSAAANTIRVSFSCFAVVDADVNFSAALFKDSDVNALQATTARNPTAGYMAQLSFQFEHSPATTSAVTYKIRAGPTSGTMYINGNTANRRFGGAAAAILRLEEIKA